MAASTVIKHLYDGKVTLLDGTGTPVSLDVPFSVGDLSLSGLAQTQRDVVVYQTRGSFGSLRHTARNFPTGSFSFQVADYSDATNTTAINFMLKNGSYSANTSTLGTASDVYTIDIKLTVEGTNFGDSTDHTITMEDCHVTFATAEGEPNTVSVDFTVYGQVTFV